MNWLNASSFFMEVKMIKNINVKIIASLLLIIMLISNLIGIFPLLESLATNVGDEIHIQSIGTVKYHLKSRGVSTRRICHYRISRLL